MAEKKTVVLVQDNAGRVVAIRLGGGAEVPVLHAGPVMGLGVMNLTITIENVDIEYARREAPSQVA